MFHPGRFAQGPLEKFGFSGLLDGLTKINKARSRNLNVNKDDSDSDSGGDKVGESEWDDE